MSGIKPKKGYNIMKKQSIIEILPREAQSYKINLHTHSTLSDGNFSPADLKKKYMEQGYSAVAFTDHRACIPHEDLTDESFVALTGFEADFSLKDEKNNLIRAVHLNALAKEPSSSYSTPSMPLDFDLINKTVADLKQRGFWITLNHPVWSNMSSDDVAKIKGFDAMEVCNSIAVVFNNYSDDSAFYEYFLRDGGRAVPVAADDTHKIFEDGTPFWEYYQSFTVVKASELSYRAIMDALERGCCYASTGPQINGMWLEGDLLHIECSPVYGVFVHSKYLTCKTQDVKKTDCITHTVLDISEIRKSSPYFWVQLRDTEGKKAWTTPYWFD